MLPYQWGLEFTDCICCRGVKIFPTPKKNTWCSNYYTKLYLIVRPRFWSSGECGILISLSLLLGPLWPGVVVLVWVSFRGQIDMFNNYSYFIGICTKKVLGNNFAKYINMNVKRIYTHTHTHTHTYIYILSSTDRLFRSIRTLQCD